MKNLSPTINYPNEDDDDDNDKAKKIICFQSQGHTNGRRRRQTFFFFLVSDASICFQKDYKPLMKYDDSATFCLCP